MKYELKFDPSADKTIRKWKKSNPNLYKKLGKILHEQIDHPRTGTGHPEALLCLQLNINRLVIVIMTGTPQDLVNKGSITEMVTGLEMMRYQTPIQRSRMFY